jgi:hypothetical protein
VTGISSSSFDTQSIGKTAGPLPIDLDAMRTDDGWFEAPSWPCAIDEIKALHDGWWRALLDFVLECAPGDDRDAVLLSVSATITRTIPLVETALALERADALGMRLVGGPPEVEYLRGVWKGAEVPQYAEPDTKAIIAARHPFIRCILSTRRFTPVWKIPLRLAMHQGKVVAHNNLLFAMARDEEPSLVFKDSGSLFNGIRKSFQSDPLEDQVANLARSLTDRLIGPTPIGEPYRSRLNDLVNAKLSRILRITLRDIQAVRQAKLPNLIWGNSGSQYAARVMAIEILRRSGETRFFTHAGTTGMIHKPNAFVLAELAVSSTFVLETQAAAEQKEMTEACRTVAPLQNTRIIGGGGNKTILNLPLNRRGSEQARSKVVYVGMPSRGFMRHGLTALPEVSYLDWQFRLTKFLLTLPIEFINKPHPGGYFSGQKHPLEQIAKTSYARFEEVMEQADVFLFDGYATTTIWEALCTDRRVVFFDLGMHKFHQAVEPIFQRRCQIVRTTYDNHNRPIFDPGEVEAAIFDRRAIDASEFRNRLIGPNTGPQSTRIG